MRIERGAKRLTGIYTPQSTKQSTNPITQPSNPRDSTANNHDTNRPLPRPHTLGDDGHNQENNNSCSGGRRTAETSVHQIYVPSHYSTSFTSRSTFNVSICSIFILKAAGAFLLPNFLHQSLT